MHESNVRFCCCCCSCKRLHTHCSTHNPAINFQPAAVITREATMSLEIENKWYKEKTTQRIHERRQNNIIISSRKIRWSSRDVYALFPQYDVCFLWLLHLYSVVSFVGFSLCRYLWISSTSTKVSKWEAQNTIMQGESYKNVCHTCGWHTDELRQVSHHTDDYHVVYNERRKW